MEVPHQHTNISLIFLKSQVQLTVKIWKDGNAARDPEARRVDAYGRGGQPQERRVRTIDQACDVRALRALLFLEVNPTRAFNAVE